MFKFMILGWTYPDKYRIWWLFAWKTLIFDKECFYINFCGESKPWELAEEGIEPTTYR